MRSGLYFLSWVILLFASCRDNNKLPKNVLSQDKMREVLWDMMNAGQYVSSYVLTKDSIDKIGESTRVYGQVLQLHAISKEQFERSYAYYRDHPELMKVILDSLSKKQSYMVEKFQKDTTVRHNILERKKVRMDSSRRKSP